MRMDSYRYRLAPAHHFPVPFEDAYRVVKYFLRADVLDVYGVDPERVAVSGDSAGGNLAAAVAQQVRNEQKNKRTLLPAASVESIRVDSCRIVMSRLPVFTPQLQMDPDQRVKLKAQALIYPAMQALDLNTPSYRQNQHMPILPRRLMVRFWSEYFTSDKSLFSTMLANRHNSPESSSLLKYINWSEFLPESYRRSYNYSTPPVTSTETSYPFTDPRASPLLVPDAVLRGLPATYILTCEYDVLRDDGVMYATRLRRAGIRVTHQHAADGFHGSLMFTVWPTDFEIAHRLTNDFLLWLKENL